MASPQVAGIVALTVHKNSAFTATQAETILEGSAIWLAPNSTGIEVLGPDSTTKVMTWSSDAMGAGLAAADT